MEMLFFWTIIIIITIAQKVTIIQRVAFIVLCASHIGWNNSACYATPFVPRNGSEYQQLYNQLSLETQAAT